MSSLLKQKEERTARSRARLLAITLCAARALSPTSLLPLCGTAAATVCNNACCAVSTREGCPLCAHRRNRRLGLLYLRTKRRAEDRHSEGLIIVTCVTLKRRRRRLFCRLLIDLVGGSETVVTVACINAGLAQTDGCIANVPTRARLVCRKAGDSNISNDLRKRAFSAYGRWCLVTVGVRWNGQSLKRGIDLLATVQAGVGACSVVSKLPGSA